MTTGFGWHVVVAIACLLVMIQVGYRASGVKLTRTSLVAVARACVQLTLAALLITSVVRYLWASVLAVAVMFIVAVLTTTKRSGATDVRARSLRRSRWRQGSCLSSSSSPSAVSCR